MKYLIYGLQDPNTNEIRYIGQSSTGLKRPQSHSLPSSLLKKNHKSSWIISLGGVKPEIVILENLERPDELDAAEIKWIENGRAEGWKLTNHKEGGGIGATGYRHTEESKKKIGEASKLRWLENPTVFTEEIRYKCGSSMRDKRVSKETLEKRSKSVSGEKNSNWKGGKPNCKICNKKLCKRGYERCSACYHQRLRKNERLNHDSI